VYHFKIWRFPDLIEDNRNKTFNKTFADFFAKKIRQSLEFLIQNSILILTWSRQCATNADVVSMSQDISVVMTIWQYLFFYLLHWSLSFYLLRTANKETRMKWLCREVYYIMVFSFKIFTKDASSWSQLEKRYFTPSQSRTKIKISWHN